MPLDYDPSRLALLHPEHGPTVFALGANASTSALAVEAARLAYLRAEWSATEYQRLVRALALAGFSMPTLLQHPRTNGQGYAALREQDGLALLAFRGTQPDQIGDLVTDAKTMYCDWPYGPGQVHEGFCETALGLWSAVRKWLDNRAPHRQRLLICGHSLGAAIATLLALPAQATHAITLGSPRVGNTDFSQHLAQSTCQIVRLVNCCDVVTDLPPPALGFSHVGQMRYIDRDGKLHDNPTTEQVQSDRIQAHLDYLHTHAFRSGTLLTRSLADHAPINYVRAFWPPKLPASPASWA